jgi:hypothetical protein
VAIGQLALLGAFGRPIWVNVPVLEEYRE